MMSASTVRRLREDFIVAWHTHVRPDAERFVAEAKVMAAIWVAEARVSLSMALRRAENALPRSYRVECEFCGSTGPWMDSAGSARRWAADGGWLVAEEGELDVCEFCAKR